MDQSSCFSDQVYHNHCHCFFSPIERKVERWPITSHSTLLSLIGKQSHTTKHLFCLLRCNTKKQQFTPAVKLLYFPFLFFILFLSFFIFSCFIYLFFFFLIFSASPSLASMMGVSVTLDTSLKPEMKNKWSVVLSQLSNEHYPRCNWWLFCWAISLNASG